MKKLFRIMLALCMTTFLLVEPAFATENAIQTETDTTIIQLSDTMSLEITLETYHTRSINSTVEGRKSYNLKSGNRTIATATLKALFEYNGSTARVTDTDYTKTTASGCTYSHGGITTSGNRASMSGSFLYGGTSYPFSISLTCSGSGTVS